MKTILIFLCLLVVTSTIFATQRGIKITTTTGKDISLYTDYYALVIGNSNYENWPDLPNAKKDAEEVAGMLRELGFEVTLKTNLNSDEMIDALNNFTYQKGNVNDRALIFYYAGHGETETLADGAKLGFIIPTDTPLIERNPREFTKKAISMTQIEDYTLKIKSKHVLMLFDSCFSGSIFSLGRAAPKNITEKVAKPVRQFITAGNENEIVPDKSMFKTCLIDGLKEGYADLNDDSYITGRELGSYLQDNVINYTYGAQHPQFGTIRNPKLDKGDFVFMMSSEEKPIEYEDEITQKGVHPDKKILKEKNLNFIFPRVGFSSFSGFFGFELQISKFTIDAGTFFHEHCLGFKFIFNSHKSSWFIGPTVMYISKDSPRHEWEYGIGGVFGYRWVRASGWNSSVGLGLQNWISRNKKIDFEIRPTLDFAIGFTSK